MTIKLLQPLHTEVLEKPRQLRFIILVAIVVT